MASNLQNASKVFSVKPRGKYKCPRCKNGYFVPDLATFKASEPDHSKLEHENEDWEPDWISIRFSFSCVCDKSSCGEIASVAGSGTVYQQFDEEFGVETYEHFTIKSFYPAPNLFLISKKVPSKLEQQICKSFTLFFLD